MSRQSQAVPCRRGAAASEHTAQHRVIESVPPRLAASPMYEDRRTGVLVRWCSVVASEGPSSVVPGILRCGDVEPAWTCMRSQIFSPFRKFCVSPQVNSRFLRPQACAFGGHRGQEIDRNVQARGHTVVQKKETKTSRRQCDRQRRHLSAEPGQSA